VGSYQWNPVSVSEGWYVIEADFTMDPSVFSEKFFVGNGTNMSCLTTVSPTSTGSSPSLSPTTSPSLVPISRLSKANMAGIIAGSTIAAISFVAIVFAVAFCLWRRRKPTRQTSNNWAPGGKGYLRAFSRDNRGPTESTGAIADASSVTHSQVDHSPESSGEHLAAEELSPGMEKMVVTYNDHGVGTLPYRNRSESSTPSLSQWPRSPGASPAHNDTEFGVPLQERKTWTSSRWSEDNTVYDRNLTRPDFSTSAPSLPANASLLRESSPKELNRLSYGRRSSRKPVPVYDESEFGSVDADRARERHASGLSYIADLPGEKHYLIPDLPRRDMLNSRV